jgi:hypothetical protein
MAASSFTATFLYLMGGLVVWGARFLSVYAFTGLACARGWAGTTLFGVGMVPVVITLATLIGVAICVVLIAISIARLRGQPADGEVGTLRFVDTVTVLVAGCSILAMVWETLPVLFIPICQA